MGPVKGLTRMRVKTHSKRMFGLEYPSTASLFDILRASIVCDTPEALLEAYEMFRDSPEFEVCGVKNKLKTKPGPDKNIKNLHVNAWFTLIDRSRMVVEVLF